MKNILVLCIILYPLLISGQKINEPNRPDILTFSHLIKTKISEKGKVFYFRKLDNISLHSVDNYNVLETILDVNTDVVNSYIRTGFKEKGKFNNGYKNGLWKTTYKDKVVKTENYNNGLAVGKYAVYNTQGEILYKT